ncbi:MAG: DUF1232 domain-containing protein [Longimicrobiales bacterium]|nr:DUF1232 domain-containing protein [Longimicrobiales bacterium]
MSGEQGAYPEPTGHILTDIQAVIESAKARGGMEALERYIQRRLPEAEEAEIKEAAEVALEIIESIPIFLARARQEAAQRGLRSVVGPLLDHAERYFLQPVDLIPEMTYGLAGLLDDSYLLIRILENLDKGPDPFLDWDLDHPIRFLRTLVGLEVSHKLDAIAMDAMQQVSAHLNELWARMSHPA